MAGSVFFWMISGALTLMIGGLLAVALLRRTGEGGPDDTSDIEVYKDQLKEIDRDVARGVLSDDEAGRLRVEVSRRLLHADAAARAAGPKASGPSTLSGVMAGIVSVGVLASAFGIYLLIGSPGAQDQPITARLAAADTLRANRPSQSEMEAEIGRPWAPPPGIDPSYLQLVEQLRQAVADRPDEVQGQMLLATNEERIGNFKAAHAAQAEVIRIKGASASATDHANYANMLVLAVDGYVSPEAEAALDRVLADEPLNGIARYYKGLVYGQSGRHDLAFETWNALLLDSRMGDPWVPMLMGQMENVSRAAGIRWQIPPLPDAERGPSRDDIEAASDMSAADRQAMIQGMVDGLAERLAREGGPPEDWARLIRALSVLGQTERASAIWTEAQTAFDGYPDAIDQIRLAAEDAGIAR